MNDDPDIVCNQILNVILFNQKFIFIRKLISFRDKLLLFGINILIFQKFHLVLSLQSFNLITSNN